MRPKPIHLLACGICLVGLDVLAGAALRARMRAAYGDWADGMRAQGWTVQQRSVKGSAAPFSAGLVISGLSVAGGNAVLPGGLSWQADRVELGLDIWHPSRLRIIPRGDQRLRLGGFAPMTFFADALQATVRLGHGRPDRIDVAATGFVGGFPRPGQVQALRIDHVDFSLQGTRGAGSRTQTALQFDAMGIGLPDWGRWPLGATVGHLAGNVSLTSPVLSGAAPAEQARVWRDWGGALQISALTLHWGPLDVQARGSLHLDHALQPEGEGHATVAGGAAALSALAQAGTIPPGLAQTGQLVLGLMARPAADTAQADALELPLKLKHSTVTAGSLPLMTVAPVTWGGA